MNKACPVVSQRSWRARLCLVVAMCLCYLTPSITKAADETAPASLAELTLPDPLLMNDGSAVTTAEQWRTQRRPDLLELFSREMYGRAPERPDAMTFEVFDEQPAVNTSARGQITHHVREGVREVREFDWTQDLAFMDKQFKESDGIPATDNGAEQSSRPTLYLIGDSTVKNGRGDGSGGLWGWGQVIDAEFDTNRIRIANHAIGGRSSRTFLTEGRWDRVLNELKPGDFVLMQFGHNDGGQMFNGTRPRASIKGTGDETKEGVVEATGKSETVHSFGWYLRHYIAGARAKGATAIVLSPVPRNIWKEGRVARAGGDYGKWAKESAQSGGALFIDLNELAARRYEVAGEVKVAADYFTATDHTHTTKDGAVVNASCVAEGIDALDGALQDFLISEPTEKQ